MAVALSLSAGPASAQAEEPATTETTPEVETVRANVNNFEDIYPQVVGLTLLIIAAWLLPLLLDMAMAYRADRKRRELFFPAVEGLFKEASGEELDAAKLKMLLHAVDMSYRPRGVSGLSRSLFAFALLTAIGVVLVSLIALGVSENQEIVKSIVAALLGAFTTIVGVYFGARVSQEGAETAAAAGGGDTAGEPVGGGNGEDGGADGSDEHLKRHEQQTGQGLQRMDPAETGVVQEEATT